VSPNVRETRAHQTPRDHEEVILDSSSENEQNPVKRLQEEIDTRPSGSIGSRTRLQTRSQLPGSPESVSPAYASQENLAPENVSPESAHQLRGRPFAPERSLTRAAGRGALASARASHAAPHAEVRSSQAGSGTRYARDGGTAGFDSRSVRADEGLTEEYVRGDTSTVRHETTDTPASIAPYVDYLVLAAKLSAQVVISEVSL
jgi:hypothetical protein